MPRIAFLGDVMLRRPDPHAFDGLQPVLEDADLVVANLEGAITRHETPLDKAPRPEAEQRWSYRSDPSCVAALAGAGIRVVSLANNHVMDFREEGLAETLEHLDGAGIARCGAGTDAAAARAPVVVEAGGVRIGFLAAMQRYRMYEDEDVYAREGRAGPALLEPEAFAADLRALAEQADAVVALVHWGRNYRPITRRQRELAEQLAGAADLVAGHHPHIAHPVERVGATPVLFSLGNGVYTSRGRFAQMGRPPYGMAATADVDAHGRVTGLAVGLIDLDVDRVGFRPVPAQSAEAAELLAHLLRRLPLDWRPAGAGRLRAELV